MTLSTIILIISEIGTLTGMAIAAKVWISKIIEGQRCQLRADMLSIYYMCKDTKQIRQYEAEHFDKCYHAYKALKGNSFIDEIYKKAHQWEVIP
jgi:hypothetical protein